MEAINKESEAYKTYRQWKGWGGGVTVPRWLSDYFAGELTAAEIKPSSRLLEVGFGNGEFMHWARASGHTMCGMEIIPELVERAQGDGFDARQLNLCEALNGENPFGEAFDGLIAFDVLEHLTVEQSVSMFKNASALANQGAKFILRFPNGASPFSNLPQNGDHTHRQAITETKLKQLTCGTGWSMRSYGNAFRLVNPDSRFRFLKRLLFPLRDLIEIGVGALYYGHRIPLDPVATAVLVHD